MLCIESPRELPFLQCNLRGISYTDICISMKSSVQLLNKKDLQRSTDGHIRRKLNSNKLTNQMQQFYKFIT